jgi:hypothetical protein
MINDEVFFCGFMVATVKMETGKVYAGAVWA